MKLHPALLACARRQHGLVTLDQWCAHGGARASFYRLACDGVLVPLAPKVAALVGTSIGPSQRITAGVLGFGPGMVASHTSAAWLWGADVTGDAPVELTVVGGRCRTSDPRYRIHRPVDRHHARHLVRDGIPVTTATRTLVDLGASRPEAVPGALEAFLRRGVVSVPMVRAALTRSRRKGRPGVTPLDRALAELRALTDSELETVMRTVFEAVGLRGWVFHEVVEGFEVDFCFRSAGVIVEVDGWGEHGAKRRTWEQDRERDLLLTSLGWAVVRLTWRMVTGNRDAAVARLRSTLARRLPGPVGLTGETEGAEKARAGRVAGRVAGRQRPASSATTGAKASTSSAPTIT